MPRFSSAKVIAKRAGVLLYLIVFLCGTGQARALIFQPGDALTSTEEQSSTHQTENYRPDLNPCSTGGVLDASAPIGTGKGNDNWNSGINPPYILEQFMIQVLKDIGAKTSKPDSDTITQEHVIGLLAFAWGEGGGITNDSSYFNPFNTGLNNPDLIAGGTSASGTQSFKSFDAGVEGTTEAMVGSNQNRLAKVLTDPSVTAEQFVHALTYYQQYPGNLEWAQASMPQGAPGAAPPYQTQYYQDELALVKQVRSDYTKIASTVMRYPGHLNPQPPNMPSLLQFGTTTNGSGGTQTASTSVCTGSGQVSADAQGIVAKAIQDSWPSSHGTQPKPEYSADICQFNKSYCSNNVADFSAADCGIFVSTVMRASKADPNYPQAGTTSQADYVKAHPALYQILPTVKTTNDLHPGDIMIIPGDGGAGHTFIWIGQTNGNNEASASLGSRMPSLGLMGITDITGDSRGQYLHVRLIKTVST